MKIRSYSTLDVETLCKYTKKKEDTIEDNNESINHIGELQHQGDDKGLYRLDFRKNERD